MTNNLAHANEEKDPPKTLPLSEERADTVVLEPQRPLRTIAPGSSGAMCLTLS